MTLLLPLLLLLSCGAPAGDTGGASAARTDLSCDREPPLTWDNFGRGFMHTHCAGCHSSLLPEDLREGAPTGVDLDTYAGVLAWAARVEVRSVGEAPTMPPGGGPSEAERDRLAEWLACEVAGDLDALGEE